MESLKKILELEDVQKITPNLKVINMLPRETCEKIQVIIFDIDKINLKILTTNNFTEAVNKLLETLTTKWYTNELFYTSIEGFQEAMKWYDHYENEQNFKAEKLKEQKQAEWRWAIAMIKQLFEKRDTMEPGDFLMEMVRLAFQSGASDLHFQAEEWGILMRIRIDGVLQQVLNFTHEDFQKYLQKLKYMSWTKMNVDYIPQDWRFSFTSNLNWVDAQIDARVNFMPWVKTESTVIRFLDGTKWVQKFADIWFEGQTFDILQRNIEKNIWMTLVTWPTGSWKTTTLYSILGYLNDGKRKIITLEDPVEYQVSGLQQSQINDWKWYSYELWLKAVLRHDPDIVLVWETRTLETAEIAINAALTGHLVFTTLHTNSAIESISRILSMGVKPYMLAPSLNLIVAQRLVRKVCPHCVAKRKAVYGEDTEIKEAIKKIQDANPTMKLDFDGQIAIPVWCDKCNWTWYIGRIAIVETFEVTDNIKTMITEWKSTLEMYGKAREIGYLTLKEDGIIKMLRGLTTLEELRRVL